MWCSLLRLPRGPSWLLEFGCLGHRKAEKGCLEPSAVCVAISLAALLHVEDLGAEHIAFIVIDLTAGIGYYLVFSFGSQVGLKCYLTFKITFT